mgnify:FL=1|tara:strand:+ start:344 stop:580 length:237 start_codon:yes stop_codon:yes gene_type:complete
MTTEEEKRHKRQAFKVMTTDLTLEQKRAKILDLLDESLSILSEEIKKLKRKVKLNDLSSEQLEGVYEELKANAPKKEE